MTHGCSTSLDTGQVGAGRRSAMLHSLTVDSDFLEYKTGELNYRQLYKMMLLLINILAYCLNIVSSFHLCVVVMITVAFSGSP